MAGRERHDNDALTEIAATMSRVNVLHSAPPVNEDRLLTGGKHERN